MKSFLSASLIAVLLLAAGTRGFCQQNFATNVKTEISDDKMLITYDAPARDGTPYYSIILMITYNGKTIQANSMFGDYGSKVEPGMEKAITWYYTNDFKEDIKKVSVNVFAYKVNEPKVYFEIVSKSNSGYAPCEVRVTNSSANVNEYKWDFDDPESGINNLSTEKEPVHVFERAGIYKITLTGKNSLLGLEGTSYNTVEIKEHEATVADFSFVVSGTKSPYEVKFTSLSKNGDILVWNFADPGAKAKENFSDKPNPVYKYKQPGTYMVELTAKSTVSGLSDKITKEVKISAPLNPVAGFVFTLSQESAPAIVQFKNTSTNADNFKWTFGDPESGNQNSSSGTDPAHTYLKAGKFEVVLIASNPAGKSSKFSNFVTVLGPPKPPVAGFKIGNNNVIGPVTISFTNTSTDADMFSWDFGDPASGSKNSSSDASPVHTYTRPGKYAVVLRAASSKTNESNQFIDYVNIIESAKPPVASFDIDNNNSPAPANVRFINKSANAALYSWDFGDPGSGSENISSEADPSHVFASPGNYKVVLTARNSAGNAHTFSANVVVREAPKQVRADFTIENNNATAPATVRFRNSSENAVSYKWNFGDPASGANSSADANPTHKYGKSGRYTVTLTAKGAAGSSDVFSGEVNVAETPKPPVARFTIDNNNQVSPAEVSFKNTSANAVQYSWNFGDPASPANTSNDENPVHTYLKAGKYRVVMTAKNSLGAVNTWSENVTVLEPVKPPVAGFTVENNNATYPVTVRFKNTSANGEKYQWDFGDPSSGSNTSGEINPVHTYFKAGSFKVLLTATNKAGVSDLHSEVVTVTEPEKLPVAKFTFGNNNQPSPATVSFINTSSNAVGYSWNFGDPASGSNTSSESNPTHVYQKAGRFSVTLTARNQSGKSSSWTENVTVVEPEKPAVAKFSVGNNNAPSPATVRFNNLSSGAAEYSWEFGDPASGNNTSAEANPSHTYLKAGKYSVTLTAKNKSGLVSTWSESVTVAEPEKPAVAKFSVGNDNAPSPAAVRFDNLSSGAVEYSWEFGDPASGNNSSTEANPSHTYLKAGKYSVTLTAKNKSGLVSTWSENVTVVEPEKPAVAKFSVGNDNAPSPATVRFNNLSSGAAEYSWEFGDPASGNNTSAEANPSHTYLKAGQYKVTLTAKNKSGLVSAWNEKVTVVEPEKIPVAGFTISNNNAFSPATVRFTNNSVDAAGYSWDFGDPATGVSNQSTDSDPVHIYGKPGKYTVRLTAANERGTTRVFSDIVTVVAPPEPPVAGFVVENNNVIGPATVSFSNNSANATVYSWDFGDPDSGTKNASAEVNPVHTYLKPGKYTVKLTASEQITGKSNETSVMVTILEPVYPPVADFSFTLGGQYAPVDVTFTNKSENADSFKWFFGDSQSGSNESAGANPVHRYEKPGTYTITLEARSSKAGKTHVAVKEITINERYKTFFKTFGKLNSDEVATSLLSPKPGEYIALVNEQKGGSTLVTFDREGNRFAEKKLNSSMYEVVARPDNNGYLLSGIGYPNDLVVQEADKQLNTGSEAIVYSNVYDPGFRFVSLHAAFSPAGELGIVANLVNDAGQSNIWFQKTDAGGKPILARGKTFKYVGFKLANQVIGTGNGEFAVIGSYQQDAGSSGEMMLGMVNSDGSGKISSMRSKLKLTGCDILEVQNGNFEVLAARESPGNPDFSELSLKLVDRELNPMNCEIDLVGLMRTPDFKLFPPRLMPVEEGFILLSHVFNGTDSDIALLWIDKGGSILLRKEEIRRPGDQFGTALFREKDGSFVITGAERNGGGDLDAIIIKTDKQGKYSEPDPGTGK